MSMQELFPEFPPVSKADWLEQVTKDLKANPLEAMEWQISDELRISPFVHRDDFSESPLPLSTRPVGWEICESIEVSDPATANAQALEALNGGAESLELVFNSAPDWSVFSPVLAQVHLKYIGLHFSGKGIQQNPAGIFGHLIRAVQSGQYNPQMLHGSVAYDPVQASSLADWRYLVDLMAFAQDSFPQFRLISIDFSNQEDPVSALTETLQTAQVYFQKLTERGISGAQVAGAMQFNMPVGKRYFLEIAKIRAFNLLWVNFLKAWNVSLSHPQVTTRFQPAAYTDDLYTNMIRGTTMAMSAVMGGATRLMVQPYDAGREDAAKYPPAFGRRIARNVQHLLKMESHLDQMADPAAGSYYIEKLTLTLAEKAWSRLGVVK